MLDTNKREGRKKEQKCSNNNDSCLDTSFLVVVFTTQENFAYFA